MLAQVSFEKPGSLPSSLWRLHVLDKPDFGCSPPRGEPDNVWVGIWGSQVWDSQASLSSVHPQCTEPHGHPHPWHTGAAVAHPAPCTAAWQKARLYPGLSATTQLPLPAFLQAWGSGSQPSKWLPECLSDNERKCGHQLIEGQSSRLRLQATSS